MFTVQIEIKIYTLEKVIKLIMNSGYGKTLVKPPKDNLKFFDGTHQDMIENIFRKKICPTVHLLMSNIDGKGTNQYIYITKDEAWDHSNHAHIGSSVLGYSKIIMTRPKLIADAIWRFMQGVKAIDDREKEIYKLINKYFLLNVKKSPEFYTLFYCDTDSMMGSYESFFIIKSIYKSIYKKSLDGNDFGQFHVDFVMKNKKVNTYDRFISRSFLYS